MFDQAIKLDPKITNAYINKGYITFLLIGYSLS